MIQISSQGMQSPGIGDRVFWWHNYDSLPPYVVVENKSPDLSLAIEFQESDDGSTWTTIVGTSKSIPPERSSGQIITSTRRIIALFSQSSVWMDVSIIRQKNGTLRNLD